MRGRKVFIAALSCTTAMGGLTLTGCKEEPPPPPPPPPAPPPPPPAPEPINVDSLLSEMDADARLVFPQDVAPVDAGLARAVVNFAEAFLEGDDSAARSMLDLTGQAVLDRLLVTGGWYDATDELEAVHVVDLSEYGSGQGGSVTYALQTPGSAYTLSWNVEPGPGGELAFSGADSSSEERPRASDFAGTSYQAPETDETEESEAAPSGPPQAVNIQEMDNGLKVISDDAPPIMVYMVIENTANLLSNAIEQEFTGAQLADLLQYSEDRAKGLALRKKYQEGQALYDQGESVTVDQLKELVEIAKSQCEMFRVASEGQLDISEDDMYQALSETVGINPTAIKTRTGG